jgi:hypothetical protein
VSDKQSEFDELNELLATPGAGDYANCHTAPLLDACEPVRNTEPSSSMSYVQWSTTGDIFAPCSETVTALPPGLYEMKNTHELGLFFLRVQAKTEHLIDFPDSTSRIVLEEIKTFWDKEQDFKKFNLGFRRGILLWGPPGGGKSCLLQLIARDVIARRGIVIKFAHPDLFEQGYRTLRVIQPDIPIVVLMEDIDATLQYHNESDVINILDGINKIDKTVFLATTNHPERLGARIVNRPSRFDKRFKIDFPNSASREIYLKSLLENDDSKIDIGQWVKDTEEFTLAHLKELFVAVRILGNDYQEALLTLRTMKDPKALNSDLDYGEKKMGFR